MKLSKCPNDLVLTNTKAGDTMKQLTSLLLCLLLCLSFAACGGAESTPESDPAPQTQSPNELAKEVLTKVLNKEQTFSYTCMVGGQTTEETLEKFTFNLPYQALYGFAPKCYAFKDQDSDGIEELLVLDMRLHCILTLDYNEGKVIGTIKDNFDSRNYQELGWVNIEY